MGGRLFLGPLDRPRLSRAWLGVVLLLLSLLGALSATAACADPGALHAVHLRPCIAPLRAGDTPERLFAQPSRFDCRRAEPDWGPGSYWVRFTLPAVATGNESAPPLLRFAPAWQARLTIYSRDRAGHVAARLFDDVGISRALSVSGAIAIPLGDRDAPVTEVLVRLDGALNASGLLGDPQWLDPAAARRHDLVAVAVLAAFAGLGVGLFCYNLVLWLTIRERFQLTYWLSLLAMLAYVWANSGLMVQQFPDLPHTHRLATCYVMLGFAAALALQFITDFIEASKLPSALRRFARHQGLVCIAAGIAVALSPPAWRYLCDRIYAISFIPMPIIVMVLTLIAWRQGSRSVKVLAIAWVIPVAMALLRIAYALNLVGETVLVHYGLLVGMSIEALLSSLAMSYRIKLIAEDRDQARADERAARHLANIDSLTGLLNRRALLEQLIEWSSPEPLRLLLVDIDRFKTINDAFGHLVGDEVLRSVAEVLAIRADLNASVARIGGEEFALVGAAEDLSEAVALGILADIRARPMVDAVRVTVSVGMAEGPVRCEDDWRELYRRADAALYQAKNEGRNRAVHAPPRVSTGRIIAA